MQTDITPWILIQLIMVLACIGLFGSIISYPPQIHGRTLTHDTYLPEAGIGIALVTFTGFVLRDLLKTLRLITTAKNLLAPPVR